VCTHLGPFAQEGLTKRSALPLVFGVLGLAEKCLFDDRVSTAGAVVGHPSLDRDPLAIQLPQRSFEADRCVRPTLVGEWFATKSSAMRL
jgi:hypothetical protein